MSLTGIVYKDVTLAHVHRERHHGKAVMNAVMASDCAKSADFINYLRNCHGLIRILKLGVIN